MNIADLPKPEEIPDLYRKHGKKPRRFNTLRDDYCCVFGILAIDRCGEEFVQTHGADSVRAAIGMNEQQRVGMNAGFDGHSPVPGMDDPEAYLYGRDSWQACVDAGMVAP